MNRNTQKTWQHFPFLIVSHYKNKTKWQAGLSTVHMVNLSVLHAQRSRLTKLPFSLRCIRESLCVCLWWCVYLYVHAQERKAALHKACLTKINCTWSTVPGGTWTLVGYAGANTQIDTHNPLQPLRGKLAPWLCRHTGPDHDSIAPFTSRQVATFITAFLL